MQEQKNRFVIGNGVVTDGAELLIEDGAVAVEDSKIASVGKSRDLQKPGWEWIDAGGRLIVPGMVNMHHHLYSQFSTGLSPHKDTQDFMGVLRGLWWPLDWAMDEETVYWSGLIGAMDSLRYGVTTIFDHHASMNLTDGVLDELSRAIEKVGIRAVLCLEVSDRLGKDKVKAQFKENLRFFKASKDNPKIKSMLGLHANLTLSEESMDYLASSRPEGMEVHVHCGEGKEDLEYCKALGYPGPVERLRSFGMVSSGTLLIHCVHLSSLDYETIGRLRPGVVTNPESNFNNQVGSMDREKIGDYLLGTDGMTGDMVASLRSSYLMDRASKDLFQGLSRAFFQNPWSRLRSFFPALDRFKVGSDADIAVLDYVPMTDISLENLLPHLIFGAKGGKSYLTAVGGKILWRDGRFAFLDLEELQAKAKEAARKFHLRFRQNDWNSCLRKGGEAIG